MFSHVKDKKINLIQFKNFKFDFKGGYSDLIELSPFSHGTVYDGKFCMPFSHSELLGTWNQTSAVQGLL